MKDFILFSGPVFLFEIAAAFFGLAYLRNGNRSKDAKIIVYFLCLTVLVETIGLYTTIGYFSDYAYFSFIENTVFVRNYWLFNVYNIIAVVVYCEYFRRQLTNRVQKNMLMAGMVLFSIIEVINLYTHPDVYFNSYSAFSSIGGTGLVLFSIGLYYYDLLNSEDILRFNRLLPFYISVGALFLHITHTPLFIYSRYFDVDQSMEFVEFYRLLMLITNVLVYLTYAIGFIICRRKKDSSSSILL